MQNISTMFWIGSKYQIFVDPSVHLCRHCTHMYIGCFIYTLEIVQILVQLNFELVNSVLALEATEPVSEPVTQMAVEMINNHLISVQSKRDECKSYIFFM